MKITQTWKGYSNLIRYAKTESGDCCTIALVHVMLVNIQYTVIIILKIELPTQCISVDKKGWKIFAMAHWSTFNVDIRSDVVITKHITYIQYLILSQYKCSTGDIKCAFLGQGLLNTGSLNTGFTVS